MAHNGWEDGTFSRFHILSFLAYLAYFQRSRSQEMENVPFRIPYISFIPNRPHEEKTRLCETIGHGLYYRPNKTQHYIDLLLRAFLKLKPCCIFYNTDKQSSVTEPTFSQSGKGTCAYMSSWNASSSSFMTCPIQDEGVRRFFCL